MKIDNKCCLHCKHFVWWEGDYVCVKFFRIISEQTDWDTCFPTDIKSITKHREECFEQDENHLWNKLIEEIKKLSDENNTISTLA